MKFFPLSGVSCQVLISRGQLIKFSNTATIDLNVDGSVIPIKFLIYTADKLSGAFINSMV